MVSSRNYPEEEGGGDMDSRYITVHLRYGLISLADDQNQKNQEEKNGRVGHAHIYIYIALPPSLNLA